MILIFIFLIALFLIHVKHKQACGLTLLFIYINNAFDLKLFSEVIINNYNVLFLYINLYILSRLEIIRERIKNDKFGKFIIYSYVFFLIHMLFSYLLGVDSLKETSSILRQFITGFLFYFLLIDISIEELNRTLKYCAIIVLILSLCYPLYFMGFVIYDLGEIEYSTDNHRIGMVASMEFFIIYGLVTFQRRLLVTPYFIPILGGAARGSIMSILAGFTWVFRKKIKQVKGIVIGIIILFIAYLIYSEYLHEDFNRYDLSFTDELLSAVNPSIIFNPQEFTTSQGQSFNENGTFSFRIALMMERILFLLQNPEYLLFGYGMISEEQGSNIFHFILGTHNEMYRWGYCMVTSNDILWPTYILRFGLVGIFFWIMYFRFAYKTCQGLPQSKLATVGMVYAVYLLFHSFGTDMPHRFYSLFLMIIVMAYCTKTKETDKIKTKRFSH